MTRLPGREGLLVDTGAVDNIAGLDWVMRQVQAARSHKQTEEWQELARPKRVSGVGEGAVSCKHQVLVPGVLHDGTLMRYACAVIPGDPSPVPPLFGLNSMASMNVYFGTKTGRMHMVPEGSDSKIVWPHGTKFIQCEKSPSRHWLVMVSHWDAWVRRACTSVRADEAVKTGVAYPACNVSQGGVTTKEETNLPKKIVRITSSLIPNSE